MEHCISTSLKTPCEVGTVLGFFRRHLRQTTDFLSGIDHSMFESLEPVRGYYLCRDEGRTKVGFNYEIDGTWAYHLCRWMAVKVGRKQYFSQVGGSYPYVMADGRRSVLTIVDPEYNEVDLRRVRVDVVNEVGYAPPPLIQKNYRRYGIMTRADVEQNLVEFHHHRGDDVLPPGIEIPPDETPLNYYHDLENHRAIAGQEEEYHAELQRLTDLWENYP